MPLHTKTRPIADLTPHPNNPRNGDIDAIAESLDVNGQYRAIVTTADGTVIAGNHTYAAAMQLGWSELECHVLDIDPFGDEALRIMVADNRTSDLGQYDDAQLAELLGSIDDLAGTAYTAYDVKDLMNLVDYRSRAEVGDFGGNEDGAAGAAKRDGSVATSSVPEKLDTYAALDTRTILLPYSVDDYQHIVDALKIAREKSGEESNAGAVRAALNAYNS